MASSEQVAERLITALYHRCTPLETNGTTSVAAAAAVPPSPPPSRNFCDDTRVDSLKRWNDELENELLRGGGGSISGHRGAKPNYSSSSLSSVTIEESAAALQCAIISGIRGIRLHGSSCNTSTDVDVEAAGEEELQGGSVIHPCPRYATNEEADEDARAAADLLDGDGDDSNDEPRRIPANDAAGAEGGDDGGVEGARVEGWSLARLDELKMFAELLRAAGLFMRWHALTQMRTPDSISPSSSGENNPTTRLKSGGMLLLYSKIIFLDTGPDEGKKNVPDVPRYASIALFRATYGRDALSTRARTYFVESLDGATMLATTLTRGNHPVPRIFSIVRNAHNLIASHHGFATMLDDALANSTTSVNFVAVRKAYKCNGDPLERPQIEDDAAANEINESETKFDERPRRGLAEALAAILARAVRSEPPFPGDDPTDRRSDLALEILRVMFAVEAGGGVSSNAPTAPSEETMTRIGVLLCELLAKDPNNADPRAYECKLAVVALLLSAPDGYGEYLAANGGARALLNVLVEQISRVVVEKTGRNGNDDAAAVVPILMVLSRSDGTMLRMVKDEVFPQNDERRFERLADVQMTNTKNPHPAAAKVRAKNMAPLDAPKGTLRWKLIRLMTWTESNVKRAACELLWALCGKDSTQFVLRTGFGNAIHFLGVKGLVDLPPEAQS